MAPRDSSGLTASPRRSERPFTTAYQRASSKEGPRNPEPQNGFPTLTDTLEFSGRYVFADYGSRGQAPGACGRRFPVDAALTWAAIIAVLPEVSNSYGDANAGQRM